MALCVLPACPGSLLNDVSESTAAQSLGLSGGWDAELCCDDNNVAGAQRLSIISPILLRLPPKIVARESYESSSEAGKVSFASKDTHITSPPQRSRSSKADEEGEDDDDDTGRRPSTHQNGSRTAFRSEPRFLACPFVKFDRLRHSESNSSTDLQHRDCVRTGFLEISRLKQHLYRCHPLPMFSCSRCCQGFSRQDDLTKHTDKRPACLERLDPLRGFSTKQYEAVRRTKSQDRVRDWYRIWSILFPGMRPPSSPYASLDLERLASDPRLQSQLISLQLPHAPDDAYIDSKWLLGILRSWVVRSLSAYTRHTISATQSHIIQASNFTVVQADTISALLPKLVRYILHSWAIDRVSISTPWMNNLAHDSQVQTPDVTVGAGSSGAGKKRKQSSESRQNRRKFSKKGKEHEDDEDDPSQPPLGHQPPNSQTQGPLIICPYCRYDPIRYSEQNQHEPKYRRCPSDMIRNIARLKQHLHRVHRAPQYYCGACYLICDTRETLDCHLKLRPPCLSSDVCPWPEKITDAQWEEIKQRHVGKSVKEKYDIIWRMLFPDCDPPESPYMDEARGHLLDYVERISPQIRGILKKKAHLMPDTTIFQDTEEAIHDLVISCWEMSQSQREVLDPRYAQGLAAALENCATPPRSEATESESRQPALSPAQYLQPEQLFTDLLSSQIGFLNGSSEADWDWLLART